MYFFSRETDVERALIISHGKFPMQPNQKVRRLDPGTLSHHLSMCLEKNTIPEASCLVYMSTAVNLTALVLLKAMGFKVFLIHG